MKYLEVSAKSIEEAIQLALEKLGLSRDEIEVNIVKESKRSILGFGGEEATIRVRPLVHISNKEVQIAENVLETLLARVGITASIIPQPTASPEAQDNAPIAFDVEGDDLGILIGRHGQTLSSLQYIVKLIVSHQINHDIPIIIDIEGYRQRRQESLKVLAHRIAEQVKTRRMPFALKPMPAHERRVIHLALADDPNVTTQSTGEGESRKVVILLRGQI